METIIADVIAIIKDGRRKAYQAINTSMMEAYWMAGKRIVKDGRRKAYQAINTSMVEAYWMAGKRIVENELAGSGRAAYGKSVMKRLQKR